MPQTFTGQGDTNVVLQSSHLLEKSEENEASRAEQIFFDDGQNIDTLI